MWQGLGMGEIGKRARAQDGPHANVQLLMMLCSVMSSHWSRLFICMMSALSGSWSACWYDSSGERLRALGKEGGRGPRGLARSPRQPTCIAVTQQIHIINFSK